MAHFKVHSILETEEENFQKDRFDQSGRTQHKDQARIVKKEIWALQYHRDFRGCASISKMETVCGG